MGLTEAELWEMTPRSFFNKLKGHGYQLQREQAKWERQQMMHQELMLTILSPHMKDADRKKAYRDLERAAGVEKKLLPAKPQKDKDPVKFWEEIDKKTKPKE